MDRVVTGVLQEDISTRVTAAVFFDALTADRLGRLRLLTVYTRNSNIYRLK